MNEREYELATLINTLQYDIAKLKEELESKYHEGYMADSVAQMAYNMADAMLAEREKGNG